MSRAGVLWLIGLIYRLKRQREQHKPMTWNELMSQTRQKWPAKGLK